KLVRVRMEGLKNTRAIDLPFRASPRGSRSRRAASASTASSWARVQSWVLRKCCGAVVMAESMESETKKPGSGRASKAENRRCPVLTQENVGFRSARARGHACRHVGGGQQTVDGGAGVLHRGDLPTRREAPQAGSRAADSRPLSPGRH